MGDMVIVAYRPKPGCEPALLALTRAHVPALRRLGLATNRPTLAMRSRQGVIIEVFEWSEGAIARAHEHPAIQAMWASYAEVCDYVKLSDLPEAQDMFAQFEPIKLEPDDRPTD
jgi:hypothetical protein